MPDAARGPARPAPGAASVAEGAPAGEPGGQGNRWRRYWTVQVPLLATVFVPSAALGALVGHVLPGGGGSTLGGPIGFFLASTWLMRPGGRWDQAPGWSPAALRRGAVAYLVGEAVLVGAFVVTGWFPAWATVLLAAVLGVHAVLVVRLLRRPSAAPVSGG